MMFGIGFLELVVLSALGLVVVGPERLPGLLRTLGRWTSAARRTVTNIKQQVEDELQLTRIQQEIHESSVVREIQNTSMGLREISQPAGELADPSHWPGMPPDEEQPGSKLPKGMDNADHERH
jgi:sec-independent protein translocase protein TatB